MDQQQHFRILTFRNSILYIIQNSSNFIVSIFNHFYVYRAISCTLEHQIGQKTTSSISVVYSLCNNQHKYRIIVYLEAYLEDRHSNSNSEQVIGVSNYSSHLEQLTEINSHLWYPTGINAHRPTKSHSRVAVNKVILFRKVFLFFVKKMP